MNNTKQGHTPEPWKINPDGGGLTTAIFAGKLEVCWLSQTNPLDHEANARLIVAAPEMLRVLTCITNMNDAATMRDYAQEAIHSAEGGS